MYYFYLVFAVLAGSLTLYECRKYEKPYWWAAAVLAAPVTMPYFIYQSRKESGIILIMIFLTVFSGVTAAEFIFYNRYMEANRYAHLPPVTRHIIRLSQNLKQSTYRLDTALETLENLSKVESRIHEIKQTIEFIDKLRVIMQANQLAINNLVTYAQANKDFFVKKELAWVDNLQMFYNNHSVIRHYQSLQKYLDSFEELLRYTYVNFYHITEHKTEEHLKNYDEYYLRYRRAVDSHNRFNVKRITFQNQFLKTYPDIREYLPGERQTETFRLWE